MGTTDLDPIPHGLIFERFLNPERVSMPDVDINFETEDGVPVGIEDITPNVRTDAEFPKQAFKDSGHQVPEAVGRGHRVQQPGRAPPRFAGQRSESGNLRPARGAV
ncbi:hypothetical protein GCM10023086_76830 [Streptomyces venetus]|uniref:Bacterial DNA polymerase III alpha subunit NTPase domain-containing protein n=1 Tax=Streptomyces venetus TaxID=1701086 RepID=A0ABP8HLF1_9ACTN